MESSHSSIDKGLPYSSQKREYIDQPDVDSDKVDIAALPNSPIAECWVRTEPIMML